VQADVGDGTGDTAQFFIRLWAWAMSHWHVGAGPGGVFPFASELGPPRYAVTTSDGREFSDRWEQSLTMNQSLTMERLDEQAGAQSEATI